MNQPRDHECGPHCLCFAADCPCDYCRPITAKIDGLITDERAPHHAKYQEGPETPRTVE